MRDDDLEQEGRTKGKQAKERMLNSVVKNVLAPLVLADTMKNTAISKHKFKDSWKKSLENYPDSVFENNVEGIDVLLDHAPEFTAENPNTAAALGLLVDIADPISYGATKVLSKAKIPGTLAQGMMKMGDKMADSGTKSWVQKVIKKKDFKDVPRLVDYIKKQDLRGQLRHPEKLIERIDGKYNVEGKKIAEGTMDQTGQKIVRTARLADGQGAEAINRGDIYRKMKRAVESQNSDPNVSGVIKKDPYLGKLQETIKPFKVERVLEEGTPPKKPDLMPAIPSEDLETTIMNLTKEADQIKKAKAAQAAQKSEREAAEKQIKKTPVEDPKAEVESKKSAQKKERELAEKKTAKENESITAENAQVDKALLDLLLKKKVAQDNVDPMDLIPVPRAQKGLPPLPAKEVLDIQLHNKKAGLANKRYIEQGQLKEQLPSLEEQIAQLSSLERKPLKEVDVPPAMPDEAFEVPPAIPREVDVPPAIPDAAIGRPLEDVLAELSDASAAKKKVLDSNKKIAGENAQKTKLFDIEGKNAAPKVRKVLMDRISSLEDMWRLKVDARKKLMEADFDKSIDHLPQHKAMVMEATGEIDNKIVDSLKDINFAEGNAADIYRALNDDYGTQADFLELVADHMINEWRGGKTKGGAIPALTGGVAAAIAAKTSGGSIPLSTIAGATTGEAVKRGVFSNIPEIKASIGDRLSKPEGAHIATQGMTEAIETAAEVTGLTPKSVKVEDVKDDDLDFSAVPDDKLDFSGVKGRKPQSVEQIPGAEDATDIMGPQDPIDQKMDHVLEPEKPVWDPYVNEEVLNTFLPRDSKRILANPMALMAKMHQVAPNQVPVLQEMLDNDPESLVEAAPKLAVMFPALFEKDKYGMFDGKIIDPMMQQKFLKDLEDDEELDSIAKANLAMKVQRGESIKG